MTTHALMELADRLRREARMIEANNETKPRPSAYGRKMVSLLNEAATQLRTAAAEGVTPIGFLVDGVPFLGKTSCDKTAVPFYLRPPTDSGAGRDGERWRTLRDNLSKEYNHDKGYIRWYLPRARGGFMGLQEHIDSIIDSKSRADTAIAGAAGD